MKRINYFSIFAMLGKILLATVIMGATVIILQMLGGPLLLTILIAMLVYFGALFILKERLFKELQSIIIK